MSAQSELRLSESCLRVSVIVFSSHCVGLVESGPSRSKLSLALTYSRSKLLLALTLVRLVRIRSWNMILNLEASCFRVRGRPRPATRARAGPWAQFARDVF